MKPIGDILTSTTEKGRGGGLMGLVSHNFRDTALTHLISAVEVCVSTPQNK